MNDLEPQAAMELVGGHPVPVRSLAPVDVVAAAYDAHQRELYSFALHMGRDPEVAADLVQEAFLRLVREVKAGGQPDNVRAWVYRVVANLATSRGRHLKVAERFLRAQPRPDTGEAPEVTYLMREGRNELDSLLRTLSMDERRALILSAHRGRGDEPVRSQGSLAACGA